ncbi:peptidase S8/S53 domain-containing protein [Podospora australis]|uniref:Peptidase S8/S53 domain-containing protein n=1 Tax=Podospora australis TaxID=1536484 RepID=A0AAN6WMT9_9PEZI|nr:peptidase S8/S53 domain-containing protein [Podospora australis]
MEFKISIHLSKRRKVYSHDQRYLDAAPWGIDARYAWTKAGGEGDNFQLDHEVLAAANITPINDAPIGSSWKDHGTAVPGELFMRGGTAKGVGIIPKARGFVAYTGENYLQGLAEAVDKMDLGDIILIEMQQVTPALLPLEIDNSCFDLLLLANRKGITVIEPAGNGGQNLEHPIRLSDGTYRDVLNPDSPHFRDSGAIMVGGSTKDIPHYQRIETSWTGSNYGNRVDTYGWYEGIFTASSRDPSGYQNCFGGTSGASQVVAGVAAIMQSITYKSTRGMKLSPRQVRKIITQGGTPTEDPNVDRIGVMPNLRAILDGQVDSNRPSNVSWRV